MAALATTRLFFIDQIRLDDDLRVVSHIAKLHYGEMTRKRDDESGAVSELCS